MAGEKRRERNGEKTWRERKGKKVWREIGQEKEKIA
jgi:hypothetical protein